MPFYEYIAIDLESSCDHCYNIFEVRQLMSDERLTECPICENKIHRMIGSGSFIVKGKEMNQYNDVRTAKYWRDSNGIKHKVTPQDGRSNSLTIGNRKKATPEEVQQRKKVADVMNKKKRNSDSYNRFKKSVKRK